jgi:antitoxin ParD1/3/4
MQEQNEIRRLKLERLRDELAKGEDDLAAGRAATLSNEEETRALFARLQQGKLNSL